MKMPQVARILNSMSKFEFWIFMGHPLSMRWKILWRKAKTENYNERKRKDPRFNHR